MQSWPRKSQPPRPFIGLPESNADLWYIYIVAGCGDYWYTGITKDVQRRFAEHNSQGPRSARALKGRAPLTLIYSHEAGTHSAALRLELWVKSLTKAQKRSLVAGDLARIAHTPIAL